MIVSELANNEKLIRLQKYAKTCAPSLRFEYVQFLFNNYQIRYSVNVKEYNFICYLENLLIERKEKEKVEKKKKSIWRKIIKKILKK